MSGKMISKIGFGGARLGSISHPLSMNECARLLDAAKDIGITFFDTANIYGQGDSERLIGRAIRSDRDRFVVATKAGQRFSRKMRLLRPFKPAIRLLPRSSPAARQAVTGQRARNIQTCFDASILEPDLKESLRRLNTGYVDYFMLHSPSVQDLADGALHDALARIRDKGLARHVGISCDTAEVALAALDGPCVTALQLPIVELGKIRQNLDKRDIFLVARGIASARGERSVRAAFEDAVANPLIGTALVDTTQETRLRDLAGLA